MSARVFRIGQRVRVTYPPMFKGVETTVLSGPLRLGDCATDPRSSWYGFPPDTILQELDAPPDYTDPRQRVFCAWPPSWLEPIDDDGNRKIEWTEGLRKLCGLKQTEDA